MNKVILMSIQPKWLAKILNGEKTIEIRKTMPKCYLPIDVYLYCTQGKPYLTQQSKSQFTIRDTKDYTNLINGKVVAKFTLNKVEDCFDMSHIDNLVIFDKPMELGDFETSNIPDNAIFESRGWVNKYYHLPERPYWHIYSMPLSNAPQSWQYVYVKGE